MFARLALALAAASIAAGAAQAQAPAKDGWRFSGSMRLRYETVDGQVRPGFNAQDQTTNLRTTGFAEYKQGPWRFGGEIYDSRAWGADHGTPISANEVNVFEPVQAYVIYTAKPGALGPASVQAGRFLLNLGSRRLIAADDYRNTTSSYDGARIDLAPAGVKTTVFYVRPVVRLPEGLAHVLDNRQHPDRSDSSLELFGAVANKPNALLGAALEGAYIGFREADRPQRPTRDRRLDTFDARIILDPKPDRFDYELEGAVQTGSIAKGLSPADPHQSVRAGFAHAQAGYSWARPWSPHLVGLFDIATGDRGGARYGRFDTLYGMRRSDFAPTGLYNAVTRANIVSPGVRLEVTPSPLWDAFASLRAMWLDSTRDAFATTGVRDGAGRSGSYGGTQAEGRVRYWLVKDRLRAEADWVWLAKGGFLRDAPAAPRSGRDEHYLSLNLTAQF